MNHPFIARFCTPDNHYVYDVNTNGFLRVNEVVYDLMEYFGIIPEPQIHERLSSKYDEETINRGLLAVKRFQAEEGIFSTFRPKRLLFPETREEIVAALNTRMQQLILGITEQCNLRCRYCVFSGGYKYQRTHAGRWMNFEIACKAVDLFVQHSAETEHPALGFYGGEPLLAFDLIRQVVSYINECYPNRLGFHITTNGTLLAGEAARFLVANHFHTVISLDGPLPIHDAMRVYPNGSGSFNLIMENLRDLKKNYPDYFEHDISFSVCLSAPDELERVYEFFRQDESILAGKHLSVKYIDSRDTDLFEKGLLEKAKQKPVMRLAECFLTAVTAGHAPDPFLKSFFEIPLVQIHQRSCQSLTENHYPNGICTPGVRRLFCTVDGNLTLCERINPNIHIGTVEQGINYDAILEIIRSYAEISSPDCRDCWAIRFCPACYCHLYRDKFDITKKREFCIAERKSLLLTMSMYCAARRVNEHAFDYMDEIVLR